MHYRTLGRTGWLVSEMGYGMWGMAGWTGSNDDQSRAALRRAVELGCTFFDTAYAYGDGHSENLLGELVRDNPEAGLIVATKIPPKNRRWPSRRGDAIADVFPPEYITEYTQRSLTNLGLPRIDLLQFHVWEDAWAQDDGWKNAIENLRRQSLIRAVGVSVNRWEPKNALDTLRTGLIDCVQVIYNIFDQAPQDELLPLCDRLGIGVIARVPFDEGTLTGNLTRDTTWPDGDWRNTYFNPTNLAASVDRAEALRPLVPPGMSMAEMALRWILADPRVATVIPGMRSIPHVEANMATADGKPPAPMLMEALRSHRWDRSPTEWSQ